MLLERNTQKDSLSSKSSSMRSLASKATALSRRTSRHFVPRSVSAIPDIAILPVEQPEEEKDRFVPSPASTIGIPRRYSRLSFLEQPSTIRLVSSPPPDATEDALKPEALLLPFFGSAKNIHSLKERRSMAPFELSQAPPSLAVMAMGRKSMPDLHNAQSANFGSIYPPLPSISDPSSVSGLPGTFAPASPKHFIFGGDRNNGISRTQFSAAAEEVLAQMNAKLPSNATKLSHELLRGRNVEVNKLVLVNERLGEGGWGLGSGGADPKTHRFAAAHEKGFAKYVCDKYKRNIADPCAECSRSLSCRLQTPLTAVVPKTSQLTDNRRSENWRKRGTPFTTIRGRCKRGSATVGKPNAAGLPQDPTSSAH